MVIIPQTAVSVGSHIFGDTFLMTRLLGTSLFAEHVRLQQLKAPVQSWFKCTHLRI